MTKQQAPAVRPAQTSSKSSRKGQFIDFRPRRRPTPVTESVRVRRPVAPLEEEVPERPVVRRTIKETVTTISEEPLEDAADFISEEEVDDYIDDLDAALGAAALDEAALVEAAGLATPPTDIPKNPFINSVNVDKRPLSSRRMVTEDDYASSAPTVIREEDFHGEIKNTYTTRRNQDRDLSDPREKLEGEKKTVSLGFIVAIILTILLGAGVGAFIYLAFFQ